MKALISGMLIVLLAGCGGSQNTGTGTSQTPDPVSVPPGCTYEITLSPWGLCQPSGIQVRSEVFRTESTVGCSASVHPILTQSCTYSPADLCTGSVPLTCSPHGVPTACCPPGHLFYCGDTNICFEQIPLAKDCGPSGYVVCS